MAITNAIIVRSVLYVENAMIVNSVQYAATVKNVNVASTVPIVIILIIKKIKSI